MHDGNDEDDENEWNRTKITCRLVNIAALINLLLREEGWSGEKLT